MHSYLSRFSQDWHSSDVDFSYVAGLTSVIQIFIALIFNISNSILNIPILCGNGKMSIRCMYDPMVQAALEYMNKDKSAYNLALNLYSAIDLFAESSYTKNVEKLECNN